MKRIVFALCAISISLSTTAQGNLEKRLQGSPVVDSLVSKVNALGGNASVSYYNDGRLHKTVTFNCPLMNDFHPTLPTGDPKKDAQNHQIDSIRQLRVEQYSRVYEAARNTCKSLTDNAQESYTWEYHRNGVDSVRYTIAIGEYQNGDTMTTYQHNRDVWYYNAPELISFRYNSLPFNDGNQWGYKGFGHFRYEYTPDSVIKQMKELAPFDKTAYTELLQPILKQKGITSRQLYVYHDSTYIFQEKKWDEEEFVMRENTIDPVQKKSETRATIYTMHSKALADTVLSQLKATTWSFLENNSDIDFRFTPDTYYESTKLSELFEHFTPTRVPSFYYICLHSIGDTEFNILVIEGTGDLLMPMEWLILKSWKNGKVVYDKRSKTLTPKQARDYTSAHRFISKRQFEPTD